MAEKNSDISSNLIYYLGQITTTEVSIATDTTVIVTTVDKLKLALLERKDIFVGRDAWIAPFGIFISILLALLTTDFRKFYLAAAVWEAMFYVGLILTFLWGAITQQATSCYFVSDREAWPNRAYIIGSTELPNKIVYRVGEI